MRLLAHAQQPQQVGDKSQARQGKQSCFAENGGAVSPYPTAIEAKCVEEGHRDGIRDGIVAMDAAWQPFLQRCNLACCETGNGRAGLGLNVPSTRPCSALCCRYGVVWCGVVCLVLEHFLGL
jgi:hypothetical protein